ncbi:gliding motility-associated C-terminal domain-containing protein [Flavobacterium pectinovorum]|uniref:Gliding motility-associated C-terminal domain-containing protein n=2 Tax=Flavobacterium pectinovorum TaxID=29533 RepID=A0AB36P3D1_9FLAO|nr:hypothetical protein B0A72_09240 [Flavobacterium pectinovorum]SHM96938.1 gliding motility-associated C-terminal domain-containing protein [Flavobacterium pectinovorum]
MNRNKIKMNKNLLIVLALLLFSVGYGQSLKTWTGATSTAWNVDTNWSPEGRPTATDNVLITNASNQPVISVAGAACAILELSNSTPGSIVVLTVSAGSFSPASIIMNSGGGDTSDCSLTINTGKVTVTGNVTMNGTALQNDVTFSGDGNLLIGGVMTGGILNAGTLTSGKGTVSYNGTGTRAIGAYTYNNLTISGSGIRTITPSVIVNGILAMAGTATASAAPTYGANASLQYNSASSLTAGPEWVSPFIANGGVQISSVTGSSIVTLSNNGVEKRFNDGVSLVIDEGASLVATNTDLYFGGDFINNNGSLTTDGFVYLTGAVSQTIDGFTATKGVVMNKTAGVATFTKNLNTGKLIIDGAGTLNLGAGLTHSFTDWVRTQGTLNANSSLLKFSGNVSGAGSNFTAGTSTVEFNGGAQNLGTGSIIYNNLTLSGAGTKTFGAKTTINETFSIVSGVVADLTANLVHTAKSIKLGVTTGSGGSWGSSLSNAVNKNNTFFTSNNGIVNVGPTIVVSTDSLSGLTTTYGTPSSSNSFDLSGLAMLEGILVTPPSGFEVSTDGVTFSNTITIGAAGAIASTKVYVRLKGTIDAKDYSGNLVLTSNGTTTINIPIATSTVNKAPLTITAVKKDRQYGVANPVLTVTYDKFVNGDTEAKLTTLPTIVTTAVIGSAVGNYPITVSGAVSSNYDITYVANILDITPAALTITAVDNTKVYGSDNPVLTATYVGFVNGDTEAKLTTLPTIATTAVKGSAVGNYPITVSGAVSSNYTITYGANAVLAITPAALTITAIDNSKVYGSDNPVLTASYAGFVNGDTQVSLTTLPTITTTAVKTSAVGTYPIAASGAVSSNYAISYVSGTLTVIASSNAGLGDLTISEGALSPAFSEGTKDYTATVPNDIKEITVTPTTADAAATVTVNGKEVPSGTASENIPLEVGENTITTVVTAQDGTTQTYTIIVTREPSSDAGLGDLTISEGTLSPTFAEGTKDYTATVPNDVKNITVTPTTADATATVTVNGVEVPSGTASGNIPLEVGKNEITTIITAQDGTTNTYVIVVTREASNDAGLTDLVVSEGTLSPTFAEGTKDYTATVPNDVTGITVTPTIADATATVTVNGVEVPSGKASGEIPLQVGENTITTVVTAEDGTTNTYVIVVTREEAASKPSDNAGLSDIVVSEGTLSPEFNTDTKNYTVDVPNETNSIIITPTPIDPNATVEIIVDGKTVTDNTAPIDLKTGENVVTIVVTAPDGTQETYTIIVNREDAVPVIPSNIITPNGDGKNDVWVVPGLNVYPNNSVKVFDRAARLVYSKNNYNSDWDGTYKGSPLTEDTYYYLIDLGNGSPKLKGFISIIRD